MPIDPPKDLVISGLYRYSRNPIYVAYGMILLSYFLYWGQLALLIYAAIVPSIFAVWVILVEEPGLRRRFGKQYEDYTLQCLAGSVFPRSEGAPNDALGDQLQLAGAPMLLNGCVNRSAVSMAGVPTTLRFA